MGELVTVKQIADMMGRSPNNVWQYDRRRREHDEGKRKVADPMPTPVLVDGVKMWDRQEIEGWISRRSKKFREHGVNISERTSSKYPAVARLVAQYEGIPLKDGIRRKFSSTRVPGGKVAVDVTVRVILDADRFADLIRESQP